MKKYLLAIVFLSFFTLTETGQTAGLLKETSERTATAVEKIKAKSDARFEKAYLRMEGALLKGCGSNAKCDKNVGRFLRFLWDNREKRNMKVLAAKCTARTARKRGYLVNPKKMFRDMKPVGALEVSADICDCTVGDWATKFVSLSILIVRDRDRIARHWRAILIRRTSGLKQG